MNAILGISESCDYLSIGVLNMFTPILIENDLVQLSFKSTYLIIFAFIMFYKELSSLALR